MRASRFLPRVYSGSHFGDFELRHSRRLEEKKIEREKQLEVTLWLINVDFLDQL